MENKTQKRFHFGFLVLFSCCAICFSSVTLSFNTAGIFYVPVSEELNIGTGLFGSYITVQYAAMSVAMFFGGKILDRFDARAVLSVCVAMISASLLAMSSFTALWQFYIAGAFIGSANSILLYLMVPTMIDRWFKRRVGFFVGLALCFTGIGAILFNPLGGFIIDTQGWRMGYLVFGLISTFIALPCSLFLIRSFPKDKHLFRYGEDAELANKKLEEENPLEGIPYNKAIKTATLYLVALHAGLMDVGITLNYYLPAYVDSLGYSVFVVSTVASVVMVGQLTGKVALGFINDINVKYGVATAVGSGAVGIALLAFFGGVGLWVLYLGAFFFGVFFAGATVTTSLMTRGIFGSRDFGRIFSIVALSACVCAAFSSAIWGALIDLTGSYFITLFVGLAMILSIFYVGHRVFLSGDKLKMKYAEQSQEQG